MFETAWTPKAASGKNDGLLALGLWPTAHRWPLRAKAFWALRGSSQEHGKRPADKANNHHKRMPHNYRTLHSFLLPNSLIA